MDYNDPSRRQQYAQNPYAAQQQSQASSATVSQYATPGAVERFRQSSYVHQSPTTVPSTGRAGSDPHVYGFAQGSQYGSVSSAPAQSVQYGAELQSPDVSRQQEPQQYGSYMYGLAGQSQQGTQSAYDQVSRYTQRPSTTSETLASQFGGAQPTQYYLGGPSIPTSTTMPELATPQLPSQYQSAYAQAGPSSSAYGSAAMLDPTQSGAYSAYGTQYTQQSSQSADQAFSTYQTQIRTLFSHVREGRIRDVGNILLDVSHYLLGNAEALGLTRDDDDLHDERIRLWDEFNKAWLATLQAQFDMTEELIRNNQLSEPQSIMTQQSLETLSRELVRLCDSIEKHGLVDYQMGVAEEEIMDMLLRCLSLLDPEPGSPMEGVAESSSSATGRAR